jgi:methylenetetrahydrofolate dehydrogenase (NADP+)/methenyltetrahydrofolate cyclohydrolase
MAAKKLDGKELAARLLAKISAEVAELLAKGVAVKIASVQIAGDGASDFYIRSQGKQAAKAGIGFEQVTLAAGTSAVELEATIARLNADVSVSGIILQVPLPAPLKGESFQRMIAPGKDIEGVHPENLGALVGGGDGLVPCTARAAVELAVDAGIKIEGANCVVVGRSAIVGRPLALMMLARNATVTVAHSKTRDLAAVCLGADVLMSAVGAKPGLITAAMVKPGACVVDIATIPVEGGGITGDVDAGPVGEVAGWLAPVPGGVGPVTVMMLFRNALIAARRQAGMA